jgi:transposase
MNQYQRVVEPTEEIPPMELQKLFFELLKREGLCVIVEATPDYRGYSLDLAALHP